MKKIIFLLIAIFFVPLILAEERIILEVNQTEYYFYVGTEASFLVNVTNPYDQDITGSMTYSLDQKIIQQGMAYSSSKSETKQLNIGKTPQPILFGLGASNNPAEFNIELSYQYTDPENEIITLTLSDVKVFFVPKEEEKENEENKKQSESQNEEERKEEQQQKEQEAQKKAEEELKEQIEQQKVDNQIENRVQNNQMNQDSNALKKEMQKQMQEQKEVEEQFKKNVEDNEQVKQMEKELEEQGYQKKTEEFNPTNESTGEFEMEYENEQGQTQKMQGEMENNEIKDLQKTKNGNVDDLMQKLQNDSKFQEFNKELLQNGFNKTSVEFNTYSENKTEIKLNYQKNNETNATITAEFQNGELKEVTLENGKNNNWLFIISILILSVVLFLIYRKYFKKKEIPLGSNEIVEKKINYKKESLKILDSAKKLFKEKKYKDAYGKASEAIRFYYSYKLQLKTELTNLDLIRLLKNKKISYNQTQECLNLCGLVEFAKYEANKTDFDEICSIAEKIIK